MPENADPPSIAEQYAAALLETGVSQKELARRLAGTDEHDLVEPKRRWLAKIKRGELKRPRMDAIEAALNLPSGYFRLPTPAQVRAQRQVRQEELEAEVARLREGQHSFAEEVLGRLAALEAGRVLEAPQEDHQTTGEQEGAG